MWNVAKSISAISSRMTGTNSNDEILSTVSSSSYQTTNDDDSVFRTPSLTMSLRGRKRKSTQDETSFDYSLATPKRGRPKAGTIKQKTVNEKKKAPVETNNANKEKDPSGLFSLLKSGKNIGGIIDGWIQLYADEPDRGIVQLLQLFISCCGCSSTLDANMIHTVEYKNIINKLADDYEEESGDYPLILVGQPWKKFRTNFCDFIMLFVAKCKSGALFDVSVMDNLIQLLTGMADSQLRAFRHTATFAAMKLSSAIVDVVVELVELREKYTIQIETEKAKMKQIGTNERLDILLQSKADLNGKIDELSSMIQYIFKSVFVHRYRDIVPDIRCICINELGNWMRVYPAFFLEDSYLKYIGWTLFDKFAEVRLKCMAALLTLYEREELVVRLELFTNKFKERLVSMVMDNDIEVAIKACQLMTFIYHAFPNLLELNDCVPIYEIVYCSNRTLAVAAGEFLNAKVFTTTAAAALNGSTSTSLQANDVRQQLADLVTFYVEGAVHNHAAYLVDALIDINPMLKDWSTMTDMLLNDEFERYDTEMIEIMCCAVKQAATGENPAGRTSVRRGAPPTKETRVHGDERIRISEALIPTLPKLLTRFIADQEKVVNLTSIPLYFELDVYSHGRMEANLNELMQVLERIVEQHTYDEVLRNVAKILQYFITNFAVAQHTEPSRLRLIDGVAMQLRQAMQRFMIEEDQLDEEDEAALLASYRKMAAFSAALDIGNRDVWDMTLNMLNNSNRFSSPDLAEKGVLVLFEDLCWNLKKLLSEPQLAETAAAKEAFTRLKKRRDQFLLCTKTILRNGAAGVENAYLCLCDCLIIFNWKTLASKDKDAAATNCEVPQVELWKNLPVILDADFTNLINSFVVDNAFIGEEDETYKNLDQHGQVQLVYKRRNILAQYCKLIIYGVLSIIDAYNVLKQYTRFHTDFGDIFKTLLQKCREIDKVAVAKAISQSLIYSYDDLKTISTNAFVDPNSDEFGNIRELAKRFALSFGPDNVRNREPIAMVHKDGISYALGLNDIHRARRHGQVVTEKPENLSFLEVLIEFSPKLVRQDKLAVLNYLEKHCQVDTEKCANDAEWASYALYKNSLTAVKNV